MADAAPSPPRSLSSPTMANQPSAIALGITTGYGEYYHTLPDSAVEVLRRIETNHGIDSSIDALFDDQDSDSDESNPGAQMNDEDPEYSTEVLVSHLCFSV